MKQTDIIIYILTYVIEMCNLEKLHDLGVPTGSEHANYKKEQWIT